MPHDCSIPSLRAIRGVTAQRIQQQLVGVGYGLIEGILVMEFQIHLPHFQSSIRSLGLKFQMESFIRLNADGQQVGRDVLAFLYGKQHMRWATELDDDLSGLLGQRLAGTQIEGHPLPAPVVHVETQRAECGRY